MAMIRINNKSKSDGFSSLDVTPMVDIVFLLLIFFLLTTSYIEPSMDLTLPEAETSMPQDHTDPYTIAIASDGTFTLNNSPATLDDIVRIPPGRDILLLEDKDGPYGVFIEILDTLRKTGLTKISIVTDEKSH